MTTRHLNLRLTVPAAAIEATDSETRTLRGVALPYGAVGHTSAGALTIDAGAVRVPDNLRAVKLFREHGRLTPIGYATEATDARDALRMAFRVAATPDGDQALVEAAEGLRDSLSVELSEVKVENGHVTAANLVGVAQVAIPAYAGAVLTAALTDTEQADVNDLAKQIVDATTPAEDTDTDTETETPPAEAEQDPSMNASHAASLNAVPPTRATPRNSLTLAAQAITGGLNGLQSGRPGQLEAALADITPPASDPSSSLMRPAWIGELWTPYADDRPFITAIGSSPLTSMTWEGWRWNVRPTVGPYTGNKTAIPTNVGSISPATGTAARIAGGWDFDRIYEDFNTGFIEAFLSAAAADYAVKSEATLAAFLAANATVVAGPAADVTAGLNALAQALSSVGASMSYVGMATDVYASFLGMTESEVPWWLQNQGSMDPSGQSANVAGQAVFVAPSLAAGTMLAGDRNAVDFRETGPIRVNAVNIPNGGIDAALFGYQGAILHSALGIAKTTVTVAAALGELSYPDEVDYLTVMNQLAKGDSGSSDSSDTRDSGGSRKR